MAAHSASNRKAGKPAITIMLVVAVIAVLVIAVFVALPLFDKAEPKAVTPAPAEQPAQAAVRLPEGVTEQFAQRMYAEQLESQKSIESLATGQLKSISADKGEEYGDSILVSITARFTDGTAGPGYLRLLKTESGWFYASVGGGNSAAEGLSEAVAAGDVSAVDRTDEEVIAAAGDITFDTGVINTILSQSKKNASLAEDLYSGKIASIQFGEPKQGAGTVTIPATIEYREGENRNGEAVIVSKTVDDRQLYFLTTLKTD